ncbi:serpin family protein [Candidatus Zixiibacteriota bacterium]
MILNIKNSSSLKAFAFLILVAALCLQCTDKPTQSPSTSQPIDISEAEKALIESDNKFGLTLFRHINAAQGDSNIFISPLSISMALGMTLNGADGATREAMEQTLELSGLTREEINHSYRHLIDLLTQLDPKVQFDIANSIWYNLYLPEPEATFLERCQQYFDALVTALDFSLPEAAPTINAWVEESTQGKIEEIVDDPIDPDICMFLINAIYFKGSWVYQFDESQTEDEPFYLLDGSTTTCQLMAQKAVHGHLLNENFSAVDLPYGDGSYSMTLFLPEQHRDPDDLIERMTPENVNAWLSQFASDSVDVFIPRFKLEYFRELKDDLTALGMGIAFDPNLANFRNMYSAMPVWISKVKHKTFVEVNEEGTEAAAVTSVEMEYSAIPETPVFRADRPFVFMIRENESGTILFIGKIVDPTAG